MQKEYKDYIPPESGKEYALTATSTGRTKIEDVTQYAQEGASWGAADILSGCEMEFTHSKSGSVHNLTNPNANAVRGRAKMTADVAEGDTWTVNGKPVTAYMGTEDATASMAGQAYTGKWVTFVIEDETLNLLASPCIPFKYSTDPVDTGGKWLDGKHIWKKVVQGNLPSTSAASSYPIGDAVDTVVSVSGFAVLSNSRTYPLATNIDSGVSISFYVDNDYVSGSQNSVSIKAGSSIQGARFYMIIEYTKA